MAKLHKVEFYLVDYDCEWDNDSIENEIESTFKWHGIYFPADIQTADIGEWDDTHKFNFDSTPLEEYEKEFEGSNE